MAKPKATFSRGEYSRFSISMTKEDRGHLDALRAKYEKRVGCRVSISILLSLMLRELRPEASA